MSKLFVAMAVPAVVAVAPVQAQTNLTAAGAGGHLVFYSSQDNDSDWAADNLIDGSSTQSWSGPLGRAAGGDPGLS